MPDPLDPNLTVNSPTTGQNPWGHANQNDSITQGTTGNAGVQVNGTVKDGSGTVIAQQQTTSDNTKSWAMVFNLAAGTYNLFVSSDPTVIEIDNLTVA